MAYVSVWRLGSGLLRIHQIVNLAGPVTVELPEPLVHFTPRVGLQRSLSARSSDLVSFQETPSVSELLGTDVWTHTVPLATAAIVTRL